MHAYQLGHVDSMGVKNGLAAQQIRLGNN